MPYAAVCMHDDDSQLTDGLVAATPEAAEAAAIAAWVASCVACGQWDTPEEAAAAVQDDLDEGRITVLVLRLAA